MIALVVAIVVAVAFDVTNGFHDSANSVAALVATRAARPGAAVLLAGACHVADPLLMGTAVADTVGGVVDLPASVVVAAVGAAVTAAIGWNLFTWWRGLPSSSSHALVGACVATQGLSAVRWGGFGDGHVDGVLGVLVGLAISPLLGAGIGWLVGKAAWRMLRRARHGRDHPAAGRHWASRHVCGAVVGQAHRGSLADGRHVPGRMADRKTVGRGIYRLRPLDGLISQGGSAMVIFTAAMVGAPVSTTHVVSASVVGVGAGRRARRVRWAVVAEMASAWCVTLPAAALLAAFTLPLWRLLA